MSIEATYHNFHVSRFPDDERVGTVVNARARRKDSRNTAHDSIHHSPIVWKTLHIDHSVAFITNEIRALKLTFHSLLLLA